MSVAQTGCRRMGLVANTRLEVMSKELSVVQCEVISWHFLAGSEEKQEIPTSRSQSRAPFESRWRFESEATATFCKL